MSKQEKPSGGKKYRRSNALSALKRKNLKLLDGIRLYQQEVELTPEQEPHVKRLKKAIGSCAAISLYGEHSDKTLDYIASHTCDNKFCFVCNWGRQRAIRSKYIRFFSNNQTVVKMERLKKGLETRYCTTSGEKKLKEKGWEAKADCEFDLMHLTLSVPHTAEGYKGKRFYFDAVKTDFEHLRRADFWDDYIYGGEFGCEFTRREHGLHIHIHALLLVRKPQYDGERTRNELYRKILLYWNHRTAWSGANRTEFSAEELAGIMKGNEKILTAEDIENLNPQGSTFIDLSSIFYKTKNDKIKYVYDWAYEWNEGNRLPVVAALMETISYHFKPQCWDNDNDTFYFDLLIDTLPALYMKSLYGKFGALATEKSLNISSKPDKAEYEAAAALAKAEAAITGDDEFYDRQFFLMDAAHMYHLTDQDLKPVVSNVGKRKRKYLSANNGYDAFDEMSELVKLNTQMGVNIYECS